MPNHMPIIDAKFETALQAQARRLAAQLIKRRARAYFQRPLALETVTPGLSDAAPDAMIATAKYLLAQERQAPRRWFGFGSEAPALNAHAALLLGRVFRRAARPHRPSLSITRVPE